MRGAELADFVDRWLQSWTGNQPAALLDFYAPDAYYQDPARPAGLHGHAEMRPYFEKLLAANPNWIWRADEVLPTEKGCCLKWRAAVPTRSGEAKLTGLDIVEIVGGKISRNEVYFDPSAMRS